MKKNVLVIGTSGHAKVIIDIIEREGKYNVVGLIDTYREKGKRTFGYEILGKEEDITQVSSDKNVVGGIVAIGDNFTRLKVVDRIKNLDPEFKFVNAIHPKAVIGSKVKLGQGIAIMPGVIVNTQAEINDFCILNTKSTLDHECIMHDFSSLGPGTNVGGKVEIGYCTAVSLGAKVIENIKIGEHCVIGAGALVIRDVESYQLAFGVPTKNVKRREKGDSYLAGSKNRKL